MQQGWRVHIHQHVWDIFQLNRDKLQNDFSTLILFISEIWKNGRKKYKILITYAKIEQSVLRTEYSLFITKLSILYKNYFSYAFSLNFLSISDASKLLWLTKCLLYHKGIKDVDFFSGNRFKVVKISIKLKIMVL